MLAHEAKKSYEKALAAYSTEGKMPASTHRLCLVDEAVLCEDLLGDAREAKKRIDETLAAKDLPVFFHVSTLVTRGVIAAAAAMNPGEYEDNHFIYAKKLLAGAAGVKPNHPLAAHIAERYAWSLMDQWKVAEASRQFSEAYDIRFTDKGESPFAAIFLFQNRHGIAMSYRYRGLLGSARRIYKSLVDDVKVALAEAQREQAAAKPANLPETLIFGNLPQVADIPALRERLSNSLERWGDCELFGGAASDGKVNLSQAAESYDQARKIAPEWSDAKVMGDKLAIVTALNGKSQAGQDIFAELDADKRPVLEGSSERAALAHQLAKAVLLIKGSPSGDGRKALRGFLDQFKLYPTYRDSNRRETMEFQLFAAELLLASDLENEAKMAPKDRNYLDPLLAAFKGRRDVRPYLRRYYELAVRACNKNDLVQIAHYLIESRMDERKGTLDSQATLVLFSFTDKDNFAIFLPQGDGRKGKRFALEITRDQIKRAKGMPLRLDEELVELIRAERQSGRRVEIFWDDRASRPEEDSDALSDRDWPFGTQIELTPPQAE